MKQLTGNSKVALIFGSVVCLEALKMVAPGTERICRAGEALIGAGLCVGYIVPLDKLVPEKKEPVEEPQKNKKIMKRG